MINFIRSEVKASIGAKQSLLKDETILQRVSDAASLLTNALRKRRKVLVAGNGGSAADAQHFAAEFVGRYRFDRPGMPCIALTTDTSILTAVSNDLGYEQVFARQLSAMAEPEDIFIAISTSGNSKNLLRAFEFCEQENIRRIALTGSGGGQLAALAEILICVPSDDTPRIQECHTLIGHIFCSIVEQSLFGKGI